MGCLEDMGVYVECMPRESVEGNLYRAILLVAGDDFVQARVVLDTTQRLLDTQVHPPLPFWP